MLQKMQNVEIFIRHRITITIIYDWQGRSMAKSKPKGLCHIIKAVLYAFQSGCLLFTVYSFSQILWITTFNVLQHIPQEQLWKTLYWIKRAFYYWYQSKRGHWIKCGHDRCLELNHCIRKNVFNNQPIKISIKIISIPAIWSNVTFSGIQNIFKIKMPVKDKINE